MDDEALTNLAIVTDIWLRYPSNVFHQSYELIGDFDAADYISQFFITHAAGLAVGSNITITGQYSIIID